MIDVIIVAHSKTAALRRMTQNCLDSLQASERPGMTRVVLVETCRTALDYPDVSTIRPEPEPLNYNRYLNAGLLHCHAPLVVCCNNDLIFQPGWLTSHLQVFRNYPYAGCLSSRDPLDQIQPAISTGVAEGYQVNRYAFQWCMTFSRTALDAIGPFDECFPFYGADDAIMRQLQRCGVRHFLNADSHVNHLACQSHDALDPAKRRELTYGQGAAICRANQELLVQIVAPGSPIGVAGVP